MYMPPEKWQSMINIMASNNTSPATKRLALRLLFATYVMGPHLTGRIPWVDARYVAFRLHPLVDANHECTVHSLNIL